ncbi:Acetyltransferase (GNAT) family protein [compost metagenome]
MIRLEPLTGHHDRSGFECGADALDGWLKTVALQHQKKGISRTFVAVPAGASAAEGLHTLGYTSFHGNSVLGFYALASAYVQLEEIPPELSRRFPRQVPVTRLGRLAVHSGLQGQGLGRLLLADAMNRALGVAQDVGSAGMVVDAKDEAAADFYRAFGFSSCGLAPLKLFLPFW